MRETLLKIKNLVVGYPDRSLSSPLNLELPQGSRLGIIGANGSGKSTLVKTLLGLIPPVKGTLEWQEGSSFGYIPQEDQISPLFPLTVVDLLKMGMMKELPRLVSSSQSFEEAALAVLKELEIVDLKDRLFRELSRGQRQRALIARALIGTPRVLILDEPYSALDDLFKKKIWQIFSHWLKNAEFSFFIIEHDLNRVINQVDWIILLGPQGTLCGPKSGVITAEALSRAYGSKLHLHEENGEKQIHFL